jgi:ribosomal protein S2
MIALIIKTIESVTSQKEKIAGAIKKKVALECGRMCIKQMKDNADILIIYDSIAETALETMVDVSRNLNVKVISEAATNAVDCCMGLFSRK